MHAPFHARALLRVCADNGMCSYDVTPAARKAELAAIPATMVPPTLVCAALRRCTALHCCAALRCMTKMVGGVLSL